MHEFDESYGELISNHFLRNEFYFLSHSSLFTSKTFLYSFTFSSKLGISNGLKKLSTI